MKLLSVELNNFRNINLKRIDFINEDNSIRNFTAIIGDNGVGKTSILEAITKGYTPIVRTISKSAVEKCDLNDNDIKSGEAWTAIKLTASINNEKYSWYNKRRTSIKFEYNSKVNDLLGLKKIKSVYEEEYKRNRLPLVLYYGTDRVIRDIPKRGHLKEFGIEDSLKNCFDNVNYFRDFYEWFKTEEDIELREKADCGEYVNIKLDSVRKAVERMIPGYKNLRIRFNPSRMIITNKKGVDLRIEQLSGGYKAILSMVSDIAKRLALANPNSKNPLEEEAIILIDELDLHLHPKWQKNISADLKRTFPRCQFIITTHSPFIIQSLNKNEVINIENENCYREGSFNGWSIEEIQEYEMGVSTKTEKYNGYIDKFSEAIDNENLPKAKELYDELVEMVHPNSTEKRIIDIDIAGI
ncbi:TPA: AAA family ATPase [Clostridium perfringens]